MFMNPKSYKLSNLLLFLFVSIATLASAQTTRVSGRVIDADTQEPIPFVNVFFANTSIGASTDADGNFSFGRFAAGKYDLTVTYVGYSTFQQTLDFSVEREQQVNVTLRILPKKLNEIVVKPDTTGWARNYREFKRLFLGETGNAAKCSILNPKDIHLFRDPETNSLVAHSIQPIQVENRALGYTLQYYLIQFEVNYSTGNTLIYGIPQYKSMPAQRRADSVRWARERKRAYEGSMLQFVRQVQANGLKSSGFEVKVIRQIPNPLRMSQSSIDANLQRLQTKMRSELQNGSTRRLEDSISFFMEENRKSKTVEVMENTLLSGRELFGDRKDSVVTYTGKLYVRYRRENKDPNYMSPMGEVDTRQNSFIHFTEPARLYATGYFDPPKAIFLEKYWAWSEKIADMLPLDYLPPVD
jgi:hypothetical protein